MEQFLLRLQEKRVYRGEEDWVLRTKSKSGKFSVKTLHSALDSSLLSDKHYLKPLHTA